MYSRSEKEQFDSVIQLRIEEVEREIRRLEKRLEPMPPENMIGRKSKAELFNKRRKLEAELSQAREKLNSLRDAQAGLGSGEFGKCRKCKEHIPASTLILMPESQLCLTCRTTEI